MDDLINNLLKLSRISSAQLVIENVNLSELVKEIINKLKDNQPERDMEIIIDDNILVQGDITLLTIALENLLNNAWKFSEKEPKSKIEFGRISKDGGKAYFIRDNGVGFDMKQKERLFIPFQRLHSEKEYPGTGIGLSIVNRILKRHGGRVWAEAEPGKGATFYFSF